MRFTVAREEAGSIRIQASGQVDVARLRRETDEPLLAYLRGSTEWRLAATVRDRRHDYVIESNLFGVESSLPAPFAKSAQERVPVRFERRERTRGHDLISFAYGDVATGQLLLDKIGNAGIRRGEIVLGGSAPLPQRDGIWIAGTLDRIDVNLWQDLLTARAGAGKMGGTAVAGINVSAQQARAFSREFHDVRAVATQRDGVWAGRLDSREIAGDAKWLPDGDGMIVGRFSRLHLPAPTAELVPAPEPTAVRPGRGGDLPSVDVTADDFRMGERQFGRLALLAVPSGADWRIERLELTSPDGAFSVNGLWQAWAVNPRTQINLKLEVNDIGRFFARMALPQGIQGGKARLEGPLTWAGPPYALDFATLSGQLALTAKGGRFVKIDPGIGKLLRRWRKRPAMHVEAEQTHAQAAELDVHVRILRQLANGIAPLGEHLVAPPGVGADADRAADMVEHDRRLREGTGEIGEFAELGEIHPGVKAEAERVQPGKALEAITDTLTDRRSSP
jgi:uncharacterized protein YhdP